MRPLTARRCASFPVLFGLAAALALAPQGARAQFAPESGFADLVERLSPAVVNIRTRQRIDEAMPAFPPGSALERFNEYFSGPQRTESSLGSGFVIDAEGVLVTNNHVIEEADDIEVAFPDGLVLNAQVVGRDPATDLAVLRVRTEETLPAVPFGDSDSARVGEWVVAIGNPFGLGNSVSVGVVSARNRDIHAGRYDDFIQTDAAINRGNSGGPLFNMDGEVIGVNSAIFSPTGGSVGVGFSIPADLALSVVGQILEHGETRRGWLGVSIQEITPEIAESYGLDTVTGTLVRRVTEDSPAERAGLQQGDLILTYGGQEIADERTLTRLVAETLIGETVEIAFVRDGERLTTDAVIERLEEGETDAPAEGGSGEAVAGSAETVIGVTVAPLTDGARREHRIGPDVEGVLVVAVEPASDAYGKIQEGDVIEEVAFERVSTPADAAARAEAEAATGKPVLLVVNRDGDLIFHSIRASAGR
ncbi:MAG: Do family serine endopeptidase [Caulobacterales bacterium]|nr:Do family serine endopeptidase [Caulobacterales bacterium]